MQLSQRASPKVSAAHLPSLLQGAGSQRLSSDRRRQQKKLYSIAAALLALHCLTAIVTSAWPNRHGGIMRAILLPELAFWQEVRHSRGAHASADASRLAPPHEVERRRDTEQEGALFGGAGARAAPAGGHHGHAGHGIAGRGAAGARDMEGLIRRAEMSEDAIGQGEEEEWDERLPESRGNASERWQQEELGAAQSYPVQGAAVFGRYAAVPRAGSRGQDKIEAHRTRGMLGWLWEGLSGERATWADRLAERMKAAALTAWEERQLARWAARAPPSGESEGIVHQIAEVGAVADAHKRTPDHCAVSLHVPKVALLFLTRGEMPHEATWEVWFRSAAGLLPTAALHAADCPEALLEHLKRTCGARSGAGVIAQQHLFTVYIHVGSNEKNWTGFPEGSIFAESVIARRVNVTWGTFALVDATRALMSAALEDPLNQKLVLISESGIPLYPPDTMWAQLMSETRSRINSCIRPGWERHIHRWIGRMERPYLRQEHWRKNSQWMGLDRRHAQIALDDTDVAGVFKEECFSTWDDGWWRDCYSDEHYFATLLASKGLDEETDCWGSIMHVDWTFGGAHPRSYSLREMTSSRLRLLRQPNEGCSYAEAIWTAAQQFLHVDQLSMAACRAPRPPFAATLGPQCPLLARKFAPETADIVYDLITDCTARLNISRLHDC